MELDLDRFFSSSKKVFSKTITLSERAGKSLSDYLCSDTRLFGSDSAVLFDLSAKVCVTIYGLTKDSRNNVVIAEKALQGWLAEKQFTTFESCVVCLDQFNPDQMLPCCGEKTTHFLCIDECVKGHITVPPPCP